MTRVAIAKWGNNLALRLPKKVVQEMGVISGSEVAISVNNKGSLLVTPLRKKPTLEELVSRITDKNRHEATDWGAPVGREIW